MSHYSLGPANHSDYRDFLRERFEFLKKDLPAFSLQACAKKSGVSKSLLQFLFGKKRHISLDKLPALARALKLTEDEEYFTYLMLLKDSARNPAVKAHFNQILSRLRHENIATSAKEPPQEPGDKKEFYENFLQMLLQSMVRLQGFREDPEWILRQLFLKDLTMDQIKEALTKLEESGLIQRRENKKLIAGPTVLWRPDPYDSSGHSVFTHAAEAIAQLMKHPEAYRPSVYMSMPLAMDEENLLAAEKFMIEVHHRLCEFASNSRNPTAAVYVGNFFLTMARMGGTEGIDK